jgi:hypothetical protein
MITAKSKRAKGKTLEKYVAMELGTLFKYAYSRADSGSGKYNKEDVSLPADVPLHIECKNHAVASVGTWWAQTINGCPSYRFPVLVYRLNYQTLPTVVMRLIDCFEICKGRPKRSTDFTPDDIRVALSWSDYKILLATYMVAQTDTTLQN